MSEKALYILAGYDDKTEEWLSGIQKKLYGLGFSGVQTKGIPMHFTLGSYDTTQEKELKERLHRISDTHKAFSVEFSHVGLFRQPVNDVLFIAPEVSREMLILKDEFMDSKDIYRWSPHTTMLIDTPDVIRNAAGIVLDELYSSSGLAVPEKMVTTLHLYEFWPTRHILSVQLG